MTAKNGPARRCPHGQHCWLGEYDAAMMKRYDLTLQDVQFLSWFGRFLQSGKMEESAERPGYYWICYRQVLKDLPSIGLSQSRYLGEMCKRLRAKGVFRGNHVEHHRRGQGGTYTYWKPDSVVLAALFPWFSAAGGMSHEEAHLVLDRRDAAADCESVSRMKQQGQSGPDRTLGNREGTAATTVEALRSEPVLP